MKRVLISTCLAMFVLTGCSHTRNGMWLSNAYAGSPWER